MDANEHEAAESGGGGNEIVGAGFLIASNLDEPKSPSPRPSPEGRGKTFRRLSKYRRAHVSPTRCRRLSLSLRERAGVRGIWRRVWVRPTRAGPANFQAQSIRRGSNGSAGAVVGCSFGTGPSRPWRFISGARRVAGPCGRLGVGAGDPGQADVEERTFLAAALDIAGRRDRPCVQQRM